jgi:hypothetical protein
MLRFLSPAWSGRFPAPRWLSWLLTTVSLLGLLPVFFVLRFIQPGVSQDYELAAWTSFGMRQRMLYLSGSGSYFRNAAASLSPLHWHSLSGYRWAVFGTMVLFAMAFAVLIAFALRRLTDAPLRIAIAVGAAATALLFNNAPSLSQGFFWFPGAVTYALPAVAAFALLGVLLSIYDKEQVRWSTWTGAAVLTVVAIGGNAVVLMFCDGLVLAGWIYGKVKGPSHTRRFYVRLLIVCGVCSAIALLAPGIFGRQPASPGAFVTDLVDWLLHSLRTFYEWLSNPFLLLFSIGCAWLLAPFAFHMRWLSLLQAFLLPLAVLLLLGLPVVQGFAAIPPPPAMNIIYAFFLLAWLLFLLRLIRFLKELPLNPAQRSMARQAGAISLLLLLLISVNTHDLRRSNFFAVTKSLIRGIPQSYYRELRARHAFMAEAKGDTLCLAPVRATEGNPIFRSDISAGPSSGNHYFAEYWGKKMVFADTTRRRP